MTAPSGASPCSRASACPLWTDLSHAAAGASKSLPANTDYRISIADAPGADSYPISSFTWILAYQNQADSAKGKKLVDFLTWALTDGENSAAALDYAPLPVEMATRVKARLATIELNGVK